MYTKFKIGGHPVHRMLIHFPIACYTGTLLGFVVYAANGQVFWLNLAIALSIGGVGTAIIAAIPGFVDFAFGVPRDSTAKLVSRLHAVVNVVALVLFAAVVAVYASDWNGPAVSSAPGIILSAIGVVATFVGGHMGGTLVADYHVGIRLSPQQELAEPEVQRQPLPVRRRLQAKREAAAAGMDEAGARSR